MGASDVSVNNGFGMLPQELGLQLFVDFGKPLRGPKTSGYGGLVGHDAYLVSLRVQCRHAG